jgi:glycosyltransferase involved in cell wall biosynthesis
MDQPLLAKAAELMPWASFVLVGPTQSDVTRLAVRPNIHLLGARAHQELPRYVQAFDVGVIPYQRCEYTEHVYPTKLNEYLAMGLPVVATDIPEIVRFDAEHRALIEIVSGPFAFAKAVTDCARRQSDIDVKRRVETARANAWSRRIPLMLEIMSRALADRAVAAG